jgi:hypothetical protein
MAEQRTLKMLVAAVSGGAAAYRCRANLRPASGQGTRVFPPTCAARVPERRLLDRARRWCALQALWDVRLAARQGHPISQRKLERLLRRRWWRRVVSIPGLTNQAASRSGNRTKVDQNELGGIPAEEVIER